MDYTRSHTIESVFKFSCVEFANQCGGSKTTSFTKKWMWSKIKIWRMLPDVLSSIQGLRKLVRADSVCICFVTKHHFTAFPWFSFSLFQILLFSVLVVNVSAAQFWNIYIYIYFFFLLSSGCDLRNSTCLLFPQHEFVADAVPFFFYQSTAF